ncbi:hypothetical protein MM440_02750 [Arsenicicoccus piscis]|uniref:Uncharacterized protein n=1 Tax=Arsenicicoccus piscis TaxID=673954 RepID=A0ABQ6HV21_9MICO|nr:hypothetical protein [Arsenicicoccus piscis]MCH8626727.1 hypothetical protein [Arsenicicoccus piscis]GMA21405.1 hypothetical protein GCM10025862_34260 [Arsenicicoccus piscis]
MYNNPAPVFAAGTAGGLTYAGFDNLYYAMGTFALIAAFSAVKRVAPVFRNKAARERAEMLSL